MTIGFIRKPFSFATVVCAALVVMGVSTDVSAALFLDTFDTDTSANYSGENSSGSGGGFQVDFSDNNALRIVAGVSNTYSVVHETAFLEVGEALTVVTPSSNTFLMITTASDFGQPDGTADFGIRLRRDGASGIRYSKYSSAGITTALLASDPSGSLDLWIDRVSSTAFEFYSGAPGARTLLGSTSLLASDVVSPLRIGTQAFGGAGGAPYLFDDLRIITINEANGEVVPTPAALPVGLFMLVGVATKRQRRCGLHVI